MRAGQREKTLLPALAAAVLLCAACAAMAVSAGLCLPPLALALAVLGVLLPGSVLARWSGAHASGLTWTASCVFGLVLFAVCAALGSASGLHGLVWLPAAFGAAGAAPLLKRGWKNRPRAVSRAAAWLCAGALALAAFYCLACAPRFARASFAGGAVMPEHDFLWNVGNAKSFLLGFPPRDLRFSGYPLTYHYLSELLCAGLAMGTGADCYDVQGALLPLLGIAFTVGALWELGGALYRGSRKKSAALLALTFLFGSASLWKATAGGDRFFNQSVYHVLTNINGMGFALGLAAAFLAAAARLFGADGVSPGGAPDEILPEQATGIRRPVWLWALCGASFALLCFAKGPIAGVAALAFLCAAAVRFLGAARAGQARRAAPVLAFAAALLTAFGALYTGFFSAGAGTSVRFDPLGTLEATYFSNVVALVRQTRPGLLGPAGVLLALVHAVCFAPAAVPLALGGGIADLRRVLRLPGERLLLSAGFLGGFLAFFLFKHESASQMYFAFFGLLCANALAVENASRLAAACRRHGKGAARLCAAPLAALALAGLATTGFSAAALWERAAPVYSRLFVEDGYTLPLTAGEEQAMAWLAGNTPETALFATNRSHTGAALEGLSNVYSGLSGRRFYMESFKYARANLGVPDDEIARRIGAMKALFGPQVTPEGAAALCREAGIDYLVYSRAAARRAWDITEQPAAGLFAADAAPEGFALVFENDDVAVYQVLSIT